MKPILLLLILASCSTFTPTIPETDTGTTLPVETPPIVLIPEAPHSVRIVFSTNSGLQYMKDLVGVANCVINNISFLDEVEAFPKYTYTDKTSKEVSASLRNSIPTVFTTYRSKNPFSRAIATTFTGDDVIYFNTRKNPRSVPEMINTLIHENLHLNGWSHGDNSPIGKGDSVNYRVGSMAEKYTELCEQKLD